METVSYKNINFQVWDLGGQLRIRFENGMAADVSFTTSDRSIQYSVRIQLIRDRCPPCLTLMAFPFRPYWRCYYANTQVCRSGISSLTKSDHANPFPQAIIYVIDSSDVARLPTSRSELLTMLSEDELKNVPVLVFANKQASIPLAQSASR